MLRSGKAQAAIVLAAAGILSWQLFVPPIVGLADQGDFTRMIGRFGYRAVDQAAEYAFVPRKFVPDWNARYRVYEQAGSEYLFVGAAALANKLISKDGSLDITLIGLVHMLAFLYAFWRLIQAARPLRAAPAIWFVALVALTDVGYAAYWNSFYAEPASCIFLLLLAAESVPISLGAKVSAGQAARWTVFAILFVMAKPQNVPPGILFALFEFRLRSWSESRSARGVALAGSLLIAGAAAFTTLTAPVPNMWSSTYDQVFMAILPESNNPVADARALGLPPDWVKYSGTGAWTPGTNLAEAVKSGVIGKTITHTTIMRFYLLRPWRIWRHAKTLMPVAFSLRPEWCGNFERSAGFAPGAKSQAFEVWSAFHEHVLAAAGKWILIALLVCPVVLGAAWFRATPLGRRQIEFYGLLSVCCLLSFVIAACGDAWDNVKHLFLFNALLDIWIVAPAVIGFEYLVRKVLFRI